jgi:glycosyltransferase involved in cell wall biosynthesis
MKVSKHHPGLRLLLLGNGPLAPHIRSIFLNGGVSDLVFMPGQVSQDHLPDYYRAADLYISTSHSDGTSISMLEAFASCTPVLLSDIPGNREWITSPGDVGWLYRVGDVADLIRGINYAIDNRNQLSPMGRAARLLAETRGNWESNFPQLFEAYKLAIN